MIKKVLLTGANGFIGQVLVKQLRTAKIGVKVLVKDEKYFPDSETVKLDVTSNWDINPCEGVDTVFHLAAKVHAVSEAVSDDIQYRNVNIEGTRKLLEAAQRAGVERFIFFSSVKATGEMAQMQDEHCQALPETPYGASKRAAEQLVLNGGYVPCPIVIRPCMVYGNTHKGNLPRLIEAIRQGFFPPLPELHNHRSMVHVDDLVQAALLVAQNPQAVGQVYIVSDGQSYSTRQLYEWICAALNKQVLPVNVPVSLLKGFAKIGDKMESVTGRQFIFDTCVLEKLIGSAWYSSAKIESELGFKPRRNLREALPEIVHYVTH
jgi:nucleoside-diphosphate-sugar epimerase